MNDATETLLRVADLTVEFPAGRGRWIHAVSGVSFDLARGETLGLVGESGCGKSSLARSIMLLPPPNSGTITLENQKLTLLKGSELRRLRSRFQMIFQDSVASLNPMRSVGESIESPLRAMGERDADKRRRLACEMMEAVGLDPERHYLRRPSQLSGGQCQRVSIARALMTEPRLLVCDEPVSALDVSIQAQIINLLRDVKGRYRLSMLFISHDLSVVKNISDRVAVMYLGRLCEVAPCAALYGAPAHPYTAALLDAVPRPDPRHPLAKVGMLPGELPSAVYPPSGCRFRTRCPRAQSRCRELEPEMRSISSGHMVACHFPLQEAAAGAGTEVRPEGLPKDDAP